MTSLAPLLEAFFADRLMKQLQASLHTVAAYRDTFRLLLCFTQDQLKKAPCDVLLTDLDAPFIGLFLDHLESKRANSPRTRNARLAAIHSFFRFVATREPAHLGQIQRILAIPQKRYQRNIVDFLTREEATALLNAPDRSTWFGRRDHALLLLAEQTGLRVSEIIGLRLRDIELADRPHVYCVGKGRKERRTPLGKQTVAVLRVWLKERGGQPHEPLFPSCRGAALSRDAVERIVKKHAQQARPSCPSLEKKRVSPHVLRHTAAVQMLQAGVDELVLALWLGHESVETTKIYVDADLGIKERALAKTAPLNTKPGRYRPDDKLLAFLVSI